MVYSSYKRQRIVYLHQQGLKPPSICKVLRTEGLKISARGTYKFLKKYADTGSIGRRPGSGRPSKITPVVKAIVDQQMEEDDETTAVQIHALLVKKVGAESVSLLQGYSVGTGLAYRAT